MADGFFPTLVSATRDVNAQTNIIYTGVSDGTDLLLVNADGSINVTVNNASLNVAVTSVIPGTGATNLGKAEDSAHTSGDVGVMSLAVRNDADTSLVSADGDYAPFQVDALGRLKVNVVASSAGGQQYAEDTAAVSGDMGTMALAVRQDTLSSSVSADGDYGWLKFDSIGRLWVNVNNTVTVTGTVAVSSVAGTVTVAATDLDIRDLTLAQDAVKVSANSTANSATNPIFVKEVDAVVSNEVNDYNAASAVAGNATSNHDYTVTGTTFLLDSIIFSSSGLGKVEVQVGPVASLVSKAVAFTNSTVGTVQLNFNPPIEVPVASTGTVRLIRTNRQNQAQDLYSTILGNDIP